MQPFLLCSAAGGIPIRSGQVRCGCREMGGGSQNREMCARQPHTVMCATLRDTAVRVAARAARLCRAADADALPRRACS
eukprot:6205029-Pleurochrysis_carterae.AAC.3